MLRATRRVARLALSLFSLSWGMSARPAGAQFVQYTPPGGWVFPETPGAEQVRTAADEARWNLGLIRLSPWFGVRDLGYNNNVFGSSREKKGDFTVTFGAGLRGYVRMGPKTVVALHALPEYVWWKDLTERRTLNGRYGTGAFGYYNHLTLEGNSMLVRQETYVSSEVEQPVDTQHERLAGAAELLVKEHFGIFARASRDRWRYYATSSLGRLGERIVLLDRTEDLQRAGLRYHFQSGLRLGLGVEWSTVDFTHPTFGRSNRGVSPSAELRLTRQRLDIDADGAWREIDPVRGSQFAPFRGPTGRFRVGWKPKTHFEMILNGRRDLIYTVNLGVESPYFKSERIGAAVLAAIGWRLRASSFVELGWDRYVPHGTDSAQRRDRVVGFGGGLGVGLGRGMQLLLDVSRLRYESTFKGGNRTFLRVQTSIGGGRGNSPWF